MLDVGTKHRIFVFKLTWSTADYCVPVVHQRDARRTTVSPWLNDPVARQPSQNRNATIENVLDL